MSKVRRLMRGLVVLILVAWACAPAHAAAPDLVLDVTLDPSTRRFSAVAEMASGRLAGERGKARDARFGLHESLSVVRASMPQPGRIRIEYEGILPPLDPDLDHRDVLQGLGPMASPKGSFLPAGTGWYPAFRAPFTYRVSLGIEGEQKGLVPGRLVSEAEGSDRYHAVFESEVPLEGIHLMTGPYEVRERLIDLDLPKEPASRHAVRLRTYFYPGMDELSEGYLEDSARYIERFSRAIGPYPFTEFSVVASPLPTGFGMPTLTYLGASVLKLPFIRATSLGHEVLHNWWGNGVRVRPASGNWSEGLTTFMADYAFSAEASEESARDMRLGWLRDLAASPAEVPLAEFRARTHGVAAVTGYAKAAMVFLMLRDLIGEAAFDAGVRAFWREHRFRAAGWADLRLAFERASGKRLDTFFDQWLHRASAPAPSVSGATWSEGRLKLVVEQPAPAYALRLPVELQWGQRREMRLVDVKAAREAVEMVVNEKPESVRLDPHLRIWRHLAPEELPPILRQWILAPAPLLSVADGGQDTSAAANALAHRLFESTFVVVDAKEAKGAQVPLLLVGTHAGVDATLASLGLPPRPAKLSGRGTAQVWTIPGTQVAVISARDPSALRSLQRALPHYGAQSWLIFDGARVIDRGAWPPTIRSVPVL